MKWIAVTTAAVLVVALGILWAMRSSGPAQLSEPMAIEATPSTSPQPVAQSETGSGAAEAVSAADSAAVAPTPTKVAGKKETKKAAVVAPVAPIAMDPQPIAAEVEVAAAPINPAEASLEASTAVEAAKSGFGINFFAGHAAGFEEGTRAFSEFLAEATYYLDEKCYVGVGQDAKKLYLIAPAGEEEFLLGDTRLFVNRELTPDLFGTRWEIELGSTLPVSKQSRDDKHITRTSVGLRISKGFFGDRVTVVYAPSFNYRFNRYATNAQGVPLEKIILAQEISATIAIIEKRLHLIGWGKGYHRSYEEFDNSLTSPGATDSFGVGAAVAVQVTNNISLEAGATRGTSMLRNVRYDSNFYDPEQTRYYGGLRLSF